MKLNIELNIDYLGEDCTLEEVVKNEIKHEAGRIAAQIIAKQDFLSFEKQESVVEIKKQYEEAIKSIQKDRAQDQDLAIRKVSTAFDDLISGKSFKVNRWGEVEKEYTIGEFIRDQVDEKLKDIDKVLTNIVNKCVSEKIRLTEMQIKKLVDDEAKRVQNENAKAVAEFIVKGLK